MVRFLTDSGLSYFILCVCVSQQCKMHCFVQLNRSKEAVLEALASTVSQVSSASFSDFLTCCELLALCIFLYIQESFTPNTVFNMLFTCCEVAACSEPLQVLHLFISMFLSLQDPTAYPYQFQDDPYLTPRTLPEFVCSFRSTLTNLALLFPAVIGHSVMIVFFLNSKEYYRLFETNPLFLIGIYSIYSSLSLSLFPSAEAVLSLHRVWPIRSQILHRQQSQVLRQRLC